MNRHRTTGRRALGLGLAFFTALLWGMLPVVLKVLVGWVDVYTLTWFRFLVAGALLVPVVSRRDGLGRVLRTRGAPLGLLIVCLVGLGGNYLTYLSGLHFVPPGTAQVVIQLAPVFVTLGGLVIFKESFSRVQALGFGLLIVGLVLFFNLRYGELFSGQGMFGVGILLIVIAALLWAAYMLAQKQLLTVMAPESVLLCIYLAGSLLVLPFARPVSLLGLSGAQMLLLCASALITLVSYVSFSTALNHVEASRIGVMVALTPLIVVVNARVAALVFPGILEPERLNAISIAGAVLVVVGTMCGSLGRTRG